MQVLIIQTKFIFSQQFLIYMCVIERWYCINFNVQLPLLELRSDKPTKKSTKQK
jgi:hypothetical protein